MIETHQVSKRAKTTIQYPTSPNFTFKDLANTNPEIPEPSLRFKLIKEIQAGKVGRHHEVLTTGNRGRAAHIYFVRP